MCMSVVALLPRFKERDGFNHRAKEGQMRNGMCDWRLVNVVSGVWNGGRESRYRRTKAGFGGRRVGLPCNFFLPQCSPALICTI